ncbi:uncharacterized protein LOC141537161 [Cotesia typhae]|uniref:uncharacterized protein LOC141537161 n=1 Tax=Cotesia typhae TaxID=2053667 RepID=UPI003D68FF15
MEQLLEDWDLSHLWPILEENGVTEINILQELLENSHELEKIVKIMGTRLTLRQKYRELVEKSKVPDINALPSTTGAVELIDIVQGNLQFDSTGLFREISSSGNQIIVISSRPSVWFYH